MGSRCVFACNKPVRCNPDTAPATVNPAEIFAADESDTSLKPGACAPFVHDVAEGNIGGNLCVFWVSPIPLFPLSLPHPIWIEESHA